MDRRERYSDPQEALRAAMEGHQSKLWTALPGIIVAFDPVRQTCDVQPSISATVIQQDGSFKELKMPILLDCPIQFPSGGGVTLTFPILSGDEVLVVFSSRCIDAWWSQGGVHVQPEFRMHDLSDGFVLPGVKSQSTKFTVSTTAAQLRTNDGQAYIELNPTTHNVKINTSGDLTAIVGGKVTATVTGDLEATAASAKVTTSGDTEIIAPTIKLTGAVNISGLLTLAAGFTMTGGAAALGAGNLSTTGNIGASNVTAAVGVSSGGKPFNTHTHGGVQTGTGTSGVPS
jgi:phage baseplate assembly protein gpV